MHWESFFVEPDDVNGDELVIRDEELRHLSRVMRKKTGDIIWAVDGQGMAYEAELSTISKTVALGRILTRRRGMGEAAAEVVLFQSLMTGSKFDWLVEKATELGVHSIVPVLTEQAKGSGGENKVHRWHRLANAAMKQCGRSFCPVIESPMSFEQTLQWGDRWTAKLLAHGGAGSTNFNVDMVQTGQWPKIGLWVGPEGGFSENEVKMALDSGLNCITLGRRRLRAETAGLVLLSQTMDRLGELSM